MQNCTRIHEDFQVLAMDFEKQ